MTTNSCSNAPVLLTLKVTSPAGTVVLSRPIENSFSSAFTVVAPPAPPADAFAPPPADAFAAPPADGFAAPPADALAPPPPPPPPQATTTMATIANAGAARLFTM